MIRGDVDRSRNKGETHDLQGTKHNSTNYNNDSATYIVNVANYFISYGRSKFQSRIKVVPIAVLIIVLRRVLCEV